MRRQMRAMAAIYTVIAMVLMACSGGSDAPTGPAPTPSSASSAAASNPGSDSPTASATPLVTGTTATATPTAAPPTDVPTRAQTMISGFVFSAVTVSRGSTVTWTNRDPVDHDVTAIDGSFASPALHEGGSFTARFDRA